MDIYDAMSRNPATVKAASSGGFTGQAFQAAFPHGPGNLLFGRSPAPEPKPGTPEYNRYLMDIVSNFVMPLTFIGEKGMANLLGTKATKGLIGEAKGLEAAGVSAPEIKQATNMHRGMDGDWRYEIDDSGAGLNDINITPSASRARDAGESERFIQRQGLTEPDHWNVPGWLAIDHPELTKAYPEFNNLQFTRRSAGMEEGSYSPNNVNINMLADDPRSTALHEMQHAVQDKEGFASGGSVDNFLGVKGNAEDWNLRKELLDLSQEMGVAPSVAVKEYKGLPEYDKVKEFAKDMEDGLFSPDDIVKNSNYWNERNQYDSIQNYERLAGEIEARDVQSRMNMTPEERRATMPDLWDNAIVRRGGGEARSEGLIGGGSKLDEMTGLPLNPDGTVTVYHHTSAKNADNIRKTGKLKSKGEPDVYFTTTKETNTGYGDTAVPIHVDPARLTLDDEFPDGRMDFRVNVGKPGGAMDVVIEPITKATSKGFLPKK